MKRTPSTRRTRATRVQLRLRQARRWQRRRLRAGLDHRPRRGQRLGQPGRRPGDGDHGPAQPCRRTRIARSWSTATASCSAPRRRADRRHRAPARRTSSRSPTSSPRTSWRRRSGCTSAERRRVGDFDSCISLESPAEQSDDQFAVRRTSGTVLAERGSGVLDPVVLPEARFARAGGHRPPALFVPPACC